ncbi:MAG: glycoside hydrolase family 16 protein [Candidatus Bathyarchaeota archaeon]|nr:glycoside hydrolase family 16 protein [Candidatus Bathyarchaeota archaeon]
MQKTASTTIILALTLLAPLYLGLTSNTPTAAAAPNTIQFSGYTWYIENSQQRAHPGPNYWSSSPQNVWVDSNGYLHLKITYSNGRWNCAEVTCTQTFGYGTYVFYLASRTDNLDKNVVLGLFAYKDDWHEVDIEFSKWGESNYRNGWFTVQPKPYVEDRNQRSFNFQLYGDYTTHYFKWTPKSVYFESFGGHYPLGSEPAGNIIKSFTSNSQVSATGVKAHMNLWLYNGQAPSNGQPVEIVIKSFQYIP